MSLVINTFTVGDYTARVFDDAFVEIDYKQTTIDRPGPWGTIDGAVSWAELIVQKYSVDGHLPPPQP